MDKIYNFFFWLVLICFLYIYLFNIDCIVLENLGYVINEKIEVYLFNKYLGSIYSVLGIVFSFEEIVMGKNNFCL